MKRTYFHFIIYLIIAGVWTQVDGQNLLIRNARFLNIHNGTFESGSILITDGKISDVSPEIIKSDAPTIDAKGKWIIPGLIDAHIHLFQSGGLYTRPDAIDLTELRSYEEERQWLLENADDILKRYLRLGITTVIDVGGPMYNFRLRDHLANPTELPNLFLTGPLVSTYLPPELDVADPPILKAKTQEEARQMVRDQLPRNPDFIKIWYISLPNQNVESTYDIVRAAIDESHNSNLPVAVHATELNTAKLAIHAGADILVHSVKGPIDEDFLRMLEENDVSYIPTLYVHGNYDRVFGGTFEPTLADLAFAPLIPLGSVYDLKNEQLAEVRKEFQSYIPDMIKRQRVSDSIRRANLKQIVEHNLPISTGTDAGNIGTMHASSYYDELELMEQAGLSNLEIIRASTINGAKVLDKDNYIGSIEVGRLADILILNSNPIDDLNALKDINKIIKGGKVHEPDSVITMTPEHLVQQQLNGYNARNIDGFLLPYSDSVKIFNFPSDLAYQGKDQMRSNYASMFERVPELHCELKNRIIMGNIVIDQERVTGFENDYVLEATAVYKIKNNKIEEVYFIRKD